MMDLKRGVLFAGVLCLVVGCAVAWGDDEEKEMSLDEVPAAVRSAIETYAAGGKIEEVCRETEGEAVVYEAEVERDSVEYGITVSAEGEILETETEITLEDVPAGVKTTLESFGRVGEVEDILKEEEGGKVTYEAEVEMEGAKLELSLSSAGVVLEVEAEARHKHRESVKDDDDDEGHGEHGARKGDRDDDDEEGEED